MIELIYWLLFSWIAYSADFFFDNFIDIDFFINNYLFVIDNESLRIILKYSFKILWITFFYFFYASLIKIIFPEIYDSIFKDD